LLNEETVEHRDNEVSPYVFISSSIMPDPTDQAEASIPTENVRDDANLNRTFIVRRKAAKRTFPWDLAAGELNLVSPPPRPQAEDIPAAKKPRLQEPFSASTNEATTKISSHDTEDHTGAEHLKGTRTTGHWTLEEDANLNSVVMKTCRKKYGKECRTDWNAIAALVPGRTKHQCHNRWRNALDPSIDRANGRTGRWAKDEDIKLKVAVQTHGGNNWDAIAALVPGRTRIQCHSRWHNVSNCSIALTAGRAGRWAEDEDLKLKDAVHMHGGKNWDEIAALVPGRTKTQCSSRWYDALYPSIALMTGRASKWTEDEDRKLKDSVIMHNGKNWDAIAALVPSRTKNQCNMRWHNALDPSIDRATGRTGKWAEDEDLKLKDAVHTHGGKNWDAIAALVPGRTKKQCNMRWHIVLNRSIDQAAGRVCQWTEDEDLKLKGAVPTQGGKHWETIAALVPGRTKIQCQKRWKDVLDPRIDRANGCTGKWTEDEDIKLKDAVQIITQTQGGKDWVATAALVPGRTKIQCRNRWKKLDPYRSKVWEKAHGTLNEAPATLGQDPY
jgi:hypothetical protein